MVLVKSHIGAKGDFEIWALKGVFFLWTRLVRIYFLSISKHCLSICEISSHFSGKRMLHANFRDRELVNICPEPML